MDILQQLNRTARMRRGGCSDIKDPLKTPVIKPIRRCDESKCFLFHFVCPDDSM